MFNTIKTGATAVKDHVNRQKYTYAAVTVAITTMMLQRRTLKEICVFLDEKGIDPLEFLNPEAYAELAETTL